MHKIYIAFIAFIVSFDCAAQKRLPWSVSTEGGMLIGKKSSSVSWEVSPGYRLGTWLPGITFGADYYQLKTYMPGVFLKKFLRAGGASPYVYGQSGIAVASKREKDMKFDIYKAEFSNRIYYEGGIGYRLPVSKTLSGLMSFGYARKDMFFTGYPYDPYLTTLPGNRSDYSFRMRRYKLKVGIIF